MGVEDDRCLNEPLHTESFNPVGFHLVTFNFVDYHVQDGWKLVPSKFGIDVLGLSTPDCILR